MDPAPTAPERSGSEFEPFAAGDAGCAVKLPIFEGPLDLLLHLIKLAEVEVTDIPIARIADQYVEYLDLMRELDLDVAGEYLLMAATLAWIKSRMLLPPEPGAEEEEGPDPRAELVARLLEYQRFKEAAAQLGERVRLGRDVFPAAGAEPERPPDEEREIEVGLLQLLEAFRRVLRAARASGAAHELVSEPVSVRDRMLAVMDALAGADWLEFPALFREESGAYGSRTLLVATFLAILELTRIGALRIYQGVGGEGAPEGPIRVRRADVSPDWLDKLAEGP
jgi:segregation and condensation protein A